MTYRLAVAPLQLVIVFVVLGGFGLLGIGLIVHRLVTVPGPDDPPVLFIVFWCSVVALFWYFVLAMPYKIEVGGPEDIRFVSVLRTTRTSASQIVSLTNTGNHGIYVLRHSGGSLRMLIQFTGFYQLLTMIKANNPLFETRGI